VDDGKKDHEAFFQEAEEDTEERSADRPEKTSKLEVTIPQYKADTGDDAPEQDNEISRSSSTSGQMPHQKSAI
jgi:hypothetical protein